MAFLPALCASNMENTGVFSLSFHQFVGTSHQSTLLSEQLSEVIQE